MKTKSKTTMLRFSSGPDDRNPTDVEIDAQLWARFEEVATGKGKDPGELLVEMLAHEMGLSMVEPATA